MGNPYLSSGESLIQSTDRISVDAVLYDLLLTTRRIVLVDSTHAQSESLQIPFAAIMSLKGGWNADGEPFITLTLTSPTETAPVHTLDLVFSQFPGEHRKEECDGWVMYLMDQIVLARQELIGSGTPAEDQETGIQPSVRRWVAPDRIQPYTKITFPRPVPLGELPIPTQPDFSPVTEGGAEPEVSPTLHEEVREDVPVVPEDETISPETGILTQEWHDDTAGARNADAEPQEQISSALPDTSDQTVHEHQIIQLKGSETATAAQSPERVELVPEEHESPLVMTGDSTEEREPAPEPEPPTLPCSEPIPSGAVFVPKTEPDILPVTERHEPDNIVWPVIPIPQLTDTVTPQVRDAVEPPGLPGSNSVPDMPAAQPPTPSSGTRRHTIIIVIAICAVIAAIAGGALIYSLYGLGDRTKPDIPLITPTPTLTPVPTIPAITIPSTGIWVKVESNSTFIGSVGCPGSLTTVGGSGTHVYHIQYNDGGIQVSFQKQEYTGEPMTVEIYNNGTQIAHRTITAPRGTIELIVDPITGSPFGIVSNRS
jgi:hypothetical protein